MIVINNNTKWTEKEDKLLQQLHGQGMSNKQIARTLFRTLEAVKYRKAYLRRKYGMNSIPYYAGVKEKNHNKKWSTSDINTLKSMTDMHYSVKEIAETLHRTVGAVRTMKNTIMLGGVIEEPVMQKKPKQKPKPKKKPRTNYSATFVFSLMMIWTVALITVAILS